MSDADSTSRRRPPTIDLTAKEVETAGPNSQPEADAGQAASAPDAAPARAGNSSSGTAPYAIGVVIGAVGVAAIAAGFWYAGLAPFHDTAQPQATVAAPDAAAPPSPSPVPVAQSAQASVTEEISGRLDRIEQALQGPPRTDAALAGRVAAADAQAKALGDLLAALTRRVDELAAAAQSGSGGGQGGRSCGRCGQGRCEGRCQKCRPVQYADRCAAKRHRGARRPGCRASKRHEIAGRQSGAARLLVQCR